MMCVAGIAVAHDLGVDLRAARLGVLVLLEHEDAGAFAHDKARSARVKGQGGLQRVGFQRKRHAGGKARNGQGIDGGLRAARDDRVGIAVGDGAIGLARRVGGGGAGGDSGQARALRVIFDGDGARRHVGDHHRDEQRRNAGRAALVQAVVLLDEGVHAADAAAHIHAEALGIDRAQNAAVLHGLLGGSHGILRKEVHAALGGHVHAEIRSVKILDLGRDLDLEIRGIEFGDGADAADAALEAVPEGGQAVADGRNHAHAGDDNSFH